MSRVVQVMYLPAGDRKPFDALIAVTDDGQLHIMEYVPSQNLQRATWRPLQTPGQQYEQERAQAEKKAAEDAERLRAVARSPFSDGCPR